MDLSKAYNSVFKKEINCENTIEHSLESEITLPEYYPDIVSVLKCNIKPNITQSRVQSGKLQIDGNALISVIYICDEKKIHCFEQRIPFSKSIDVTDKENSQSLCEAVSQFVNCRVSSQRKLSIHSSISISYKIFCKCENKMLACCEEKSVQMKSENLTVSNITDCQVKSFTVNETMELGSAQESIGQILRSEAIALLDSVKTVAGKALIKGELKIKITYLTEKNCLVEKTEGTVPISQIVELNSSDASTDFAILRVGSVDAFAKTDSSGALRMFDVSVGIFAELNIYEDTEIEFINDIYSTEYELETRKETILMARNSQKISDTFFIKQNIDFPEINIKSVLDISERSLKGTVKKENDELEVNGLLGINIILLKDNDEIISVDKDIEFQNKYAVKENFAVCDINSDMCLSSVSFTISNMNSLDIRAEIDVNALLINRFEKECIVDVSIDEKLQKIKNNASLTIYYPQQGEEIWDIAKRYNTTVKAILSENNLTDEIIKDKTKLLIPCM